MEIEDDVAISNHGFAFTPVADIVNFEQLRTIDVIGVVGDVG